MVRLAGIRLVHTLHNLQNHAGLYLKLEAVIYKFFLKQCDALRVYNQHTKDAAVARFGLDAARIHVIQDFPFHYYYKDQTSTDESRQKLDIEVNAFVYLFFGEVKPYKGLHDFIPIFLANAAPTDQLIIAGKSYDPTYFESLKNAAKNDPRIHWHHRFIDDDEVQYFFKASNVVILPFIRIDHSGSVDLAMSFSKPVITLKTDGMLHLLSQQAELLFTNIEDIPQCLANAKNIDATNIGQQNFAIADATNYHDIVKLF
jgi:beta-1,4-mannosyltransferase